MNIIINKLLLLSAIIQSNKKCSKKNRVKVVLSKANPLISILLNHF